MIEIDLTSSKMKEWFPKTYDVFVNDYTNSKRKYKKILENRIEWMLSYELYEKMPRNEKEEAKIQLEYEAKLKLTYEERCKVELTNLKINCHMFAGHYCRSDRSHDKNMPPYIIDIFYEVMKITMLEEQSYINDPTVLKSLEEFKYLLDDLNHDQDYDNDNNIPVKEESLNMDNILDKINEHGVKSLDAKELKFLHKIGNKHENNKK